jgi:CheY-like chemotaxis protein
MKALEQQLQHTQKLESLGVLSGGIAHDFNNILAVIMGYCSLIKLNYGTAEKNIPIIENAAERAAGLCRQMLAYAGKAQLTKTKINMVKKVDDIVDMLTATLPLNAVIKTDLSAEIPIIEGDASQLRQVVMNLIINASEAIGTEQGVVDVSLARIKVIACKKYEDYHGKPISPGEYVCLEVTDNGCGMDEETKWRIFEPFYTTKFTGRGLGMSAVLGIIKSHAGALQLFSQPGQGTTFKVYIPAPADETTSGENQIESAPPALWQGSGTILLVEDEDQVRDIAKNFLELFGFTVMEAVNGREALKIYQKNAAGITLVVTDMGMPVMDGYELFHKLKSLDPELPIIVSSGYGDVEVSARIGSDNIAGIISKPYNPSQLREVLKCVVEG